MQMDKQQLSEILEDDGETECDGGAGIGIKGLMAQLPQSNTVDSGNGSANIVISPYSSNRHPEPQLKGIGCGLEQTNTMEESSPFEKAPPRIEDQHHELSVTQIQIRQGEEEN